MRRMMMCRVLFILPLMLLLLPGCPKKPVYPGDTPTFFSADPGHYRGGWSWNDVLDGVPSTDTESGTDSEREVVEPDVIRRAGDLLYVLNQYRGLTVVDLNTRQVISRVATSGYPRDLYLAGGYAYVLTGYAADVIAEGNKIRYELGSRIYAVDIHTPADPVVAGVITLKGDFIDSRVVGNALYAVCAEFSYIWDETSSGDVTVSNSQPVKAQTSTSWITSVNLADPTNLLPVDTLEVPGYGTVIQASSDAIFLAASEWSTQTTAITYVDISDAAGKIAVRGNITVPGQVADQYKMDAWNGFLRVVSTTWNPNRETDITTVNLANPDGLVIAGQTRLAAAGESLFATRFDGPRAYLVTYFQVDPLFVVDLSDPAAPKVAGELTVPGWSTHIEPRGDRLIALGVDDTNGRQVCVSLFNVADPATPSLLNRVSFGDDWSWSSAYGDVKAFTVLDDTILVPFSGWNSDNGGYDRLQWIGWTKDTLTTQGFADVQGSILRSFRKDGLYYGVTSEEVAVIDAADPNQPTVSQHIPLASYVAEYLPLSTGYGAQFISQYNSGESLFETVAAPDGPAVASLSLGAGTLMKAFMRDNDVIAVLEGWDARNAYKGYLSAVRISCADPAAPQILWSQRYAVEPWNTGVWWELADSASGVSDASSTSIAAEKDAIYPYYYGWGWSEENERAILAGDRLVLSCRADSYDQVLGPVGASQGLAVIDLATGNLLNTTGLGYEEIAAMHGVGSSVYISSKTYVDTNIVGYARCAYYLQVFNPVDLAMGTSVNVPGVFLQKNSDGSLLLKDTQYGDNWTIRRVLNTVSWDGGAGAVTEQASFNLPENCSNTFARGKNLWYTYYGDTPGLGVIRIGDAGALSQGPTVAVSDWWIQFAGAHDDSVYIGVGYAAVARYDFSGETPVLAEISPVMASPLGAQFGNTNAYLPLGYGGVAVMGL